MSQLPGSIKFLIACFALGGSSSLYSIIRYQGNTAYYAFLTHELSVIYFVLCVVFFILCVASIWFLIFPKKLGLNTGIAVCLVGSLYEISLLVLTFDNIPGLKEAYLLAIEQGVLDARAEAVDFMLSTPGLHASTWGMVFIYFTLGFAVSRSRRYYIQPEKVPPTAVA